MNNVLRTLAPICTACDLDGIGIHFLNSGSSHDNVVEPDKVMNILGKASSYTLGTAKAPSVGKRMKDILKQHDKRNSKKPVILLFITDGVSVASGFDDLKKTIETYATLHRQIGTARKTNFERKLGIQILQIGQDQKAKKFFEKLDDGLAKKGKVADIVDFITFENMAEKRFCADVLLKCLLGAILDIYDQKQLEDSS